MTEIEKKSFKAQLQLFKNIRECDRMIYHLIKETASEAFNEVFKTKTINSNDVNVVLSIDEYDLIKNTLIKLKDDEGIKKINSWIKEEYIIPKEERQEILDLLL